MSPRAFVVLAGALSLSTPLALVPAAQSSRPTGGPPVPLRAGLTIVTAVNQPEQGDYESIKVITRAGNTRSSGFSTTRTIHWRSSGPSATTRST